MSNSSDRNISLEPTVERIANQQLDPLVEQYLKMKKREAKIRRYFNPLAKIVFATSSLAMLVMGIKACERYYSIREGIVLLAGGDKSNEGEDDYAYKQVNESLKRGIITPSTAMFILENKDFDAQMQLLNLADERYMEGKRQLRMGYIDEEQFKELMDDPDLLATRDWLAFNDTVIKWLDELEDKGVLVAAEIAMLRQYKNPFIVHTWIQQHKKDALGELALDY
jgi:hypothetical protein